MSSIADHNTLIFDVFSVNLAVCALHRAFSNLKRLILAILAVNGD